MDAFVRYYDPVAGRFLSTDPVLTDVNTAASFNRYTYANNNPYKYIDPDGRDSITDFLKRLYVSGGKSTGDAREYEQGGLFEQNPAGDFVNPRHPGVSNGMAVAGATYVAGVGAVAATGAAGAFSAQAPTLTRAGDIGKQIIQWGTKQSPEAVAKTVARTEQITPKVVGNMIKQGLEKSWVEKQAAQYTKAIAEGGEKLVNTQLKPRLELMEKILKNWVE